MKLYIKPGACSMASHIILAEIGGDYAVEMVDTANGETASGANYRDINPKGKVPALEVEGEVLTEGPAILQFLGDRAANLGLAPTAGSMARARVNEVLNFTGTELHIAFGPLFNAASTDAQKEAARQAVAGKLDWLEAKLSDGRPHLTGEDFTIADAYAFVVANWANFNGIALSRWPLLSGFMARVGARPAVQRVLTAEGLAA
ncbi:glutathione binding-like protein [Rhodobacter sp. SY28-1]|uniref:glutathione binding-like protein n=1 Tax=Rhodobacter sp. SY28-1 TaxID=2562317 RepID=UPI0010C060FF|nr:glutathione binding-like protein [Rhodobacter sp. SY28-1]